MADTPSLDALVDDLVRNGGDRAAARTALDRILEHYPLAEVWECLSRRPRVISLAKVRGWCGCELCRITRAAWDARGARQTLADFITEHVPPDEHHVEPWISLTWVIEHGSPMAQRQAKSILVHLHGHPLLKE